MKVICDKDIPPNSNDLEKILRLKIDREVKNQINELVIEVIQAFNHMELALRTRNIYEKGGRVLLCQYIISTLAPEEIQELERGDEIINRIKDIEFFDQINTLAGNLKSL
jgi:hypothetical protein